MTEHQPFHGTPPEAYRWAPPLEAAPVREGRKWWLVGLGIAVAVAVKVAGGVFFAQLAAPARDGRQSAASAPALTTGDCYVAGSRTDRDESVLVTGLEKVSCEERHDGEVAGKAQLRDSLGPAPTDAQLLHEAMLLCTPSWDAYAPDGWALPRHVGENNLHPTARQWAAGKREVMCVFDGGKNRYSGSVRVRPGSLNDTQLAYLRAVNQYNRAYAEQPAGEGEHAELDLRAWAGQMAEVSELEGKRLRMVKWPDRVKEPMRLLLAAKDEETAAWRVAAGAGGLQESMDRVDELFSATVERVVAVREALGLAAGSGGSPSKGTSPLGGLQV